MKAGVVSDIGCWDEPSHLQLVILILYCQWITFIEILKWSRGFSWKFDKILSEPCCWIQTTFRSCGWSCEKWNQTSCSFSKMASCRCRWLFFILCQHDSFELRKSDIRKAIVKLDTWNCAVLFVSFFDIPLWTYSLFAIVIAVTIIPCFNSCIIFDKLYLLTVF